MNRIISRYVKYFERSDYMKRMLSIAVAVMLIAALTVPALACGHGRNARAATTAATQPVRYSVCAVEDCTLTGLHYHDRTIYNSHYYGDGHEYHEYCNVESCTLTGYHEHDGEYCFGHTSNDGHGYHHTNTVRH